MAVQSPKQKARLYWRTKQTGYIDHSFKNGSASLGGSRVKRVAQAIPQEIEPIHRQCQHQGRE